MTTTSDFPEHTCAWTVVQIEAEPIAVLCKICDRTLPVGKEVGPPEPPPLPAPVVSGTFTPLAGYRYTINGSTLGGVGQHTATIDKVQWDSGYNIGITMTVSFTVT